MSKEAFIGIVLIAGLIQLAFIVWLIWAIEAILSAVRETARYSRRMAICVPMTKSQAKLFNRAFTIEELIVHIEKSGGKFTVVWDSSCPSGILKITDIEGVDPELVDLAMSQQWRVIDHLRARHTA